MESDQIVKTNTRVITSFIKYQITFRNRSIYSFHHFGIIAENPTSHSLFFVNSYIMTEICFLSSMKTRSTKSISLSDTSILNSYYELSRLFITLSNPNLLIHLYRSRILGDCVGLRIDQKSIYTNTENHRERIKNWISIPNGF